MVPRPVVPVEPWQEALRRTTVSLELDRSFCTGTWISPHAVLTAAHCVESLRPGTFYVVPSTEVISPPLKLRTGQYFIHPSYLAVRQAGDRRPNVAVVSADFAVVTVPDGIPNGASIALLDFEHTVQTNMLSFIAGYGQTGMRNGVPQGVGVLRSAQFKALYKFTNSSPNAAGAGGTRVGAGTRPTGFYWALDGEGRAEACRGDSGGPAFWVSQSTMMQFGVNSYIMSTSRDDVARLRRMAAQAQRGELLSLDDLDFHRGL
ncbi:MAG TPA: trypsin-like serine protease, partial [Myxococcaceae bacterium]|nr:trypsin-like serine protease [Myxococcaceae bacterium]